MLLGPSSSIFLPPVPDESAGIHGIYQYLRDLDPTLGKTYARLVLTTIGFLGIRGISSTGIGANNLVKQLVIGNSTQVSWTFSAMEFNTSYMIFTSTYPTNVGVAPVLSVTGIDFAFKQVVPSGMILNVCLLR